MTAANEAARFWAGGAALFLICALVLVWLLRNG